VIAIKIGLQGSKDGLFLNMTLEMLPWNKKGKNSI